MKWKNPFARASQKPEAKSEPGSYGEAAPVANSGAQDDVVLIAAAIAAYLGKSPEQFTIRQTQCAPVQESLWSMESRTGSLQ